MSKSHDRQQLTPGEKAVAVGAVLAGVLISGAMIGLAFWAADKPSGSRTVWFGVATAVGAPAAWELLKFGLSARARKRSQIIELVHLHSPLVEDALKAALELQERDEALKHLDDVIAVRVARGLIEHRRREVRQRTTELVEDIKELKKAEDDFQVKEQETPALEEEVMKAVEKVELSDAPARPVFEFDIGIGSLVVQGGKWISWRLDRSQWDRRMRKAAASEETIARAATTAQGDAAPSPIEEAPSESSGQTRTDKDDKATEAS